MLDTRRPMRTITILSSALFTGAGVLHFLRPGFFEAIVPDWFPDPRLANYASGAAEIALGLGLLPARSRKWSAYGLIALVAIVFPANIDMALNDVEVKSVGGEVIRSVGTASGTSRLVNWLRLPLQFPLACALWRIARRSS